MAAAEKSAFPPLLCFPVSAILKAAAGVQRRPEVGMKVAVYTNPG